MAKTAGKGTTVSIEGTEIGAELLISVKPFSKTINIDEVTAIDSTSTRRAASLPEWSAATGQVYWDKSDTAQGAMQAYAEDPENLVTVVITFSDGSSQTAECIVEKFERNEAARRGRLTANFTLTPDGDVTEADGA